MTPHFRLFCICLLIPAAVSCQKSPPPPDASGKLRVVVSILPQSFFVERIAAEKADVKVLVGPGMSPATYQPTPRQMAELDDADLFFRIGVPFESGLMPKIENSFPDLEVIDTRRGITLRTMAAHTHHHEHGDDEHDVNDDHEGHHEHGDDDHDGHDDHEGHHEHGDDEGHHEHGDDEHDVNDDHEGHHEHTGKDPHIWLDPLIVKTQAATICDELSRVDPDNSAFYRSNLEAFHRELDALHAEISELLEPLEGRGILVFHPTWGYFCDRYGMEQHAIEVEGKEPGPRQLAAMIKQAQAQNVSVIFVQQQFSEKSARAIAAEVGATVVRLDPLSAEYLSNLRHITRTIADSMKD